MRYVVSGTRPHSTIIDELDIDALDESDAARKFYAETDMLPDLVETIEDGAVVKSRDIDHWCTLCGGPIFRDQDWLRSGDREIHADLDDCEGAE